jgi:hypothetical protein
MPSLSAPGLLFAASFFPDSTNGSLKTEYLRKLTLPTFYIGVALPCQQSQMPLPQHSKLESFS